MAKIDHFEMKKNNQLKILRTILGRGSISRNDLKEETQLSWGTITSSVREMLDMGIIVESETETTSMGRKPINLELNRKRNYAVGLRFGTYEIKTVLLDITGTKVASFIRSIDPQSSKEQLVRDIFGAVDELLNKAGVSVDLVIGIGVGMPGAVKVDEGIAFFSPRHPNWRNVPIMQLIEERYGVYCFVEHVPNCSAIGERLYGAGRDLSNFVTILLGTGIGAGIIIDNRIYRGSTFNAGEIGHICVNPVGGKCTCGKTGCLELYASGRALTEKAEAYVRNSPNSILSRKAAENGGTINGYVIHQSAIDGDVKAQIFFHELGGYLGLGISIIVNLLNPGVVILDGGLSNASEFFMPALWESFENHIWEYSKVNIKVSQLPDATVIGAAGIVIQEIFQHGILLGNYQHEDTHQLEFS